MLQRHQHRLTRRQLAVDAVELLTAVRVDHVGQRQKIAVRAGARLYAGILYWPGMPLDDGLGERAQLASLAAHDLDRKFIGKFQAPVVAHSAGVWRTSRMY